MSWDQIHYSESHKTSIKIKSGTSLCNKRTDILRQSNLKPPSNELYRNALLSEFNLEKLFFIGEKPVT